MKTNVSLYVLCAGMFLTTGCESTKQLVRVPDHTRGIQGLDNARIYVIRPHEFQTLLARRTAMGVNANQSGIGYLGAGGYLCWDWPAEEVEIAVGGFAVVSGSSRGPRIGGVTDISMKLSLEPGKTYYLRYGINFWKGRGELVLLNEQEGKADLRKCKPGKSVPLD